MGKNTDHADHTAEFHDYTRDTICMEIPLAKTLILLDTAPKLSTAQASSSIPDRQLQVPTSGTVQDGQR
jgi:hypothetical protein